ncbi:MAG: hypothetical protein QNJ57_08975 [Flavobacteriaceae bacterium]|nr:hypothetical protein [Flavobacteriaceae bacterium]
MSEILYKRLFEVNVLHDYYLISSDGGSFFEKPHAEKESLLKSMHYHEMYQVADFLEIEPSEIAKQRFAEYKLIFRKTALGFVVGAEVIPELHLGAQVYKPRFELPDTLSLTFTIRTLATNFLSMTNIGLRPALPANYYFTNKDKKVFNETGPNHKSLPISATAEKRQAGMFYEMGTLLKFGNGLREALELTNANTNDLNFWENLKDRRYVTNADRILLPPIFSYPVKKEQNITQLKAVLEDTSSNVIKTITKNSATALQKVSLNFEMVDETIDDPVKIPEGIYTLKIQENGNPELSYTVYLNDSLYAKNHLGVIDIRMDETDSPFSLLDADGYLKTRTNAAGKKITHPVYEIRFKNRRTYWRYQQETDFQAGDITADLNPYLVFEPATRKIISKSPKGLTRTLVPFKSGANEKILPYPKTPSLRVDGKRIFSEIYINKSNKLVHS